MVLNYIWIAFFIVAFIVALGKLIFTGNTQIFTDIINSTFDSSKTAFEVSLGLTGVLSLWLGIMKIGENSGLINALSRWLSPVFCRLFPDIPKGHPVMGSIFMNMSANMLGLDNAATPMGLKAMKELQELNPQKDTASNPMIMFLVINTSGLILIPISIMVYRAQMGAAQPTDIFIPILLSTFVSTLVGVIAVSISQRINLKNKPILILIGILSLIFGGLMYLFTTLSREEMGTYSTLIANIILFGVIILFILTGIRKKINVYAPSTKESYTLNTKKDQCIRLFCRRGERGFHHRRTHHSLSGRFSGRYCCIPYFRGNGYPRRRYWLCSRTLRTGHELCRRSTHRIDEIAQWKRCQRIDDRYDERIRTGLFRIARQLRCTRCFGHNVLYFSSVLRQRRHH